MAMAGAAALLARSTAQQNAQENYEGKPSMSKADLQDPSAKYPKPPYKRQSQPWPGLAGKMDPRPDHGETSYRGSGRLAGRKALITGGDSGMGRAAAIAYAREGADVAINYLPSEEPDAKEVIALIRAEGRTGLAIPGDLRDEKFCRELVSRAVEGLGGLDIVVSNAGRQQTRASILDVTTEDFDATAALPHLKPGSVIIGTASEQAYDPSPDLYDYAQTKAATMNYVKSLAKQLAPKGIRVNAVAPDRSGPRFRSPAAPPRRSLKSLAARPRSAAPGSRRNSARSMSGLPRRMPALLPVRSMVRRVARVSPNHRLSPCLCAEDDRRYMVTVLRI